MSNSQVSSLIVASRRKQVAKMVVFTCNGLILTSCLAMLLLLALGTGDSLVECQEQLTVESRQQKDNDDLTDTIKYLEKLDKYFSQIARPRFGRSEFKQQPIQFRLSQAPAGAFGPLSSGSGGELNYLAPRYGSLIDLVNTRLGHKYRDSSTTAY